LKMDRDLDHSYASLLTAKKKYLGKFELNQHMHMVNAMRFGSLEPADTRLKFVKDVYDILSMRKLSLATPFLANLRKGGNVASCFIIALEDDLDSIYDNIKRVARISKNGGGLGIYLGHLRAKGSPVGGADNAAGTIVQWVKVINDTLVAVNQGGKRAGSGTVALPIWHNDIYDFLDMQSEHGDPRLKAYDVFPQVVVPDIFMERSWNKQPWITFCPYEVRAKLGIDVRGLYGDAFTEAFLKIEEAFNAGKLKVARKIDNARELVKLGMRTQFETGLPYYCFIDTINEANPNKHDGYIVCTNLCTESYSNVSPDKYGHVCNLASINLGNIKNFDDLAKVSQLSQRILDYGISLTNNPDPITMAHNGRYRTIGIGIMGLHDYLAREWKTYGNHDLIRKIAEIIEYNAALSSVEMARTHGSFDAFEGSEWHNGNLTNRFASHSDTPEKWNQLQDLINLYGMRNSQLTSPAPTTSTSIYQDASASVLPIFDAFFSDDNKNGSLKVAAKFLKDNPLSYSRDFSKFIASEIIDVISELQKYTDTGISMELIFDHNREGFNAKDLFDAIHYAHQKKIKAIYYIRNIKNNAILEHKEDCAGCAG
jgi:ribonucleoside-diphosphate reductase alpha chain